jgi:hypothetical protein
MTDLANTRNEIHRLAGRSLGYTLIGKAVEEQTYYRVASLVENEMDHALIEATIVYIEALEDCVQTITALTEYRGG